MFLSQIIEMNLRQRILKAIYPFVMKLSQKGDKGKVILKPKSAKSNISDNKLSFQMNNGTEHFLREYLGKKILLVNTASDCGYTNQYSELQQLFESQSGKLQIIGFPANDFKEQEKLDDQGIAAFCQVNFGVTFPLAKKSVVIRKAEQNQVFDWLTDSKKNGWNDQEPDWNFSKYLLDEQGELIAYFGPAISPLDEQVTKMIA